MSRTWKHAPTPLVDAAYVLKLHPLVYKVRLPCLRNLCLEHSCHSDGLGRVLRIWTSDGVFVRYEPVNVPALCA